MARPREFDIDVAIERACDVFWKLGYDAASLPDLLEGMGLTRGSLYKAFDDKKSLFLRVLDHYDGTVVEGEYRLLTDPAIPEGRDRIRILFSGVSKALEGCDTRGCLLCSAASGPAAHDPEISAKVRKSLDRFKAGIAMALAASTAQRGWDADRRDRPADHHLTQYVGLRILSRSLEPLSMMAHATQTVDELLA